MTQILKATIEMPNHYGIGRVDKTEGMEFLRRFFSAPTESSFCLFSTSGVHGTYTTIEEHRENPTWEEDGTTHTDVITFLIVQHRICSLIYGNCIPTTDDDYKFLKNLREEGWAKVRDIGRDEGNPESRSVFFDGFGPILFVSLCDSGFFADLIQQVVHQRKIRNLGIRSQETEP